MNISSESFSTDRSNSLSYSACNSTGGEDHGFTMFSMVDIITVLLSLPTNSYVIWLIVTGTGNGLAAEFFNFNLSVCEILLCTESLLGLLSYVSDRFLRAVDFLDGLDNTGRPLFQCLICVERYLAVVHPVTFLKYKPLRYRAICAAFAWVICAFSCIYSFIVVLFSLVEWYLISWLAQFFIFLSIQLFCCVAVLRALKRSGPGERGREREEENNMKRRAFNLILITTVTTVIIYTPYITLTLLDTCSSQNTHILESLGYVCFVFAGLVQPVLFLYRVEKLPFIKC